MNRHLVYSFIGAVVIIAVLLSGFNPFQNQLDKRAYLTFEDAKAALASSKSGSSDNIKVSITDLPPWSMRVA